MLFPQYDALIHVDSDTLFFDAPQKLWAHFKNFDDKQIMGIATNNRDRQSSWYINTANIPFATEFGINTGVALMNLTRMRAVEFERFLDPTLKNFGSRLRLGDQDLLNIYFHYNPNFLYLLPCNWNFITDHCSKGALCTDANTKGIGVLHGLRNVFMSFDGEPAFKVIFDTMQYCSFQDSLRDCFVTPVKEKLSRLKMTCAKNILYYIVEFMQ